MVTISSDVQTSFHNKLAQGSAKPPLNFKIASLRIRGGGAGAPLRYFNDGGEGGLTEVHILYPQKNPISELVYPKKSLLFNTGFLRALENPGKFLKPWKPLEKPWKFFYEALVNLTELY